MNPLSFVILFAACVAQLAIAAEIGVNGDATDINPDELWEQYKVKQGKKFASPFGEAQRKGHFFRSHAVITDLNKAKSSFKCSHNHMSDWTPAEKKSLLGKSESVSQRSGIEETPVVFTDRADPPTTYDLRENSTCVGPVKDQGQCGSCWSFSAVAPIEWSLCKKKNKGKYVAVSEQQLVNCDTLDYGCDGGDTAYNGPWKYLTKTKRGLQTEASYPYAGVKGACNYKAKSLAFPGLAQYGHVAQDVTSIKNAMLTYGTLSTCVYVSGDAFFYYKDGVYESSECGTKVTNHCVALIGWTVYNGTPAWIMRNSWGPGWGRSGYMLVKSGMDMCGIEREVGYVVVS